MTHKSSHTDITQLLLDIRKEYGTSKPSITGLANFITGFGVSEGIALASLIVAGWAYLNPRDPEKSPRCRKLLRMSNRICGGKFVHTQYDEQNARLIMICEHGHRIVKRTSLR